LYNSFLEMIDHTNIIRQLIHLSRLVVFYTIERFVALCWPFILLKKPPKFRLIVYLLFFFILAFLPFLPLFSINYDFYFFTEICLVYLVPFFIIAIANFVVVLKLFKNLKNKWRCDETFIILRSRITEDSVIPRPLINQQTVTRALNRETRKLKKTAITLFVVSFEFIILNITSRFLQWLLFILLTRIALPHFSWFHRH
jgi:hypothetical protein